MLAIAVTVLVGFVALAWKSPAWPIALAWLPSILISFLGRNPFPTGAISFAYFGWTALALAFAYSRGNEALRLRSLLNVPVLVTVALTALLIVRLSASGAYGYGVVKVELFIAENLTALVAGIAVARYADHFRTLLVWLVVVACLTSVVLAQGLAAGATEPGVDGRYSLDQADSPIGLGRSAAQGILIAIFFVLVTAPPLYRMLALGSLPLIGVAFLASGSRGPVLGLVAGLIVIFGLTFRERRMRARALLVVVAMFFAGLLVTQLVPGEDVQRSLSVLTGSGGGLSSNGRSVLWSEAWHVFRDHPLFGIGTGGFAALEPIYTFPHNMFLELGLEVGILGMLGAAAVVVGGVLALRRTLALGDELRAEVGLVGALLAAAFVNAQVSGDITANAAVWLAVGLALGLAQRAGAQVPAVRPLQRVFNAGKSRLAGRHGSQPPMQLLPRRDREPEPERYAGEIVVPAEGATVGGIVFVGGHAARTGWAAASVRLELSRDGETWEPVASDGAVFDVVRLVGDFRQPFATVRSLHAANLLVAELERRDAGGVSYAIEKIAGRASLSGRDWSQEWDARAVTAGDYLLRAVTIGVTGAETTSDARRVHVRTADLAPAEPAVVPSVDPAREARAAELDRRERELQTAEAALVRATSELEAQRRQELAAAEAQAAREAALRAEAARLEAEEQRRLAEETERREREAEAARQAARLEAEEQRRAEEAARHEREEQERRALAAEPVAAAPAAVPPSAASGTVDFRALEQLVHARPDPDLDVQMEREAMLDALRPYADHDGLLPASLIDLALGAFDELVNL